MAQNSKIENGQYSEDPMPGLQDLGPSSPEYVKRTAQLFECLSPESEHVNGDTPSRKVQRSSDVVNYSNGLQQTSPCYLRAACSNSGYRTSMNYDSKDRDMFRSAASHRESLVLGGKLPRDSSHVLEMSSLRHTQTLNGATDNTSQFVNISTSTRTISTFRSSGELETVNETHKVTRDSDIGVSGKTLRSPEKLCSSFQKSFESFERKANQPVIVKATLKQVETVCTIEQPDGSSNKSFIEQRIERLYGPAALAQGFYFKKATRKQSQDGQLAPKAKEKENAPKGVEVKKESRTETLVTTSSDEKNGHYFLKLLQEVTDKLAALATLAEIELENGENLVEEVSGKLRAAAGKARLLIRQKLHQFEGLCHKNLTQANDERFPTTNEDLAGFWDMVLLQVVQVYAVFDEIKLLKDNNWQPLAKTETTAKAQATKKTTKKATTSSPVNEKAEAAKRAREEARRKMMEDRKRRMQQLKENKNINNDV